MVTINTSLTIAVGLLLVTANCRQLFAAPQADAFYNSTDVFAIYNATEVDAIYNATDVDADVAAPPHLPLPDYHAETGGIKFFPRIVGGTLATFGEFPGKVSLQNRQGSHFCGGTLIDAEHVLTAAHCVTDDRGRVRSPSTIQVMGADLSILSAASAQRQVRRLSHIFVHTRYNIATMRNDVAVLRVSAPFQLTDSFRPLALATRTPPPGTTCQVAGWGATVENGTVSARLMRMSVEVLATRVCNQRQSYNGLVRDGMICAGTMLGGRDSCQGDSGGGMICDGLIAGVVSFGYGCARPNFPGIYADVSAQLTFVRGAQSFRGLNADIPVPTTTRPNGAATLAASGGLWLTVVAVGAVLWRVASVQ